MNRFHFRLEKVLQLRRDERDACRVALSAALGRVQHLQGQRAAVEASLLAERAARRESSGPGPLNLAQVRHQCQHEAGLQVELRQIEASAAEASGDVERSKRDLQAAERALGILQKLRERRYAQFVAQENAREQGRLDEAAARSHRQHAEGSPC
jgi:flagellar FliJ protein